MTFPSRSTGGGRLGESGIAVPVPEGWVDKRRAEPNALLLEVEHRPVIGLFPTRGMWVGRWYPSGDPATELERLRSSSGPSWSKGPTVAGLASVVREDVIGPPFVHSLPAALVMHRRILRMVAHDRLYEVGFWGPQGTLDDEVERAVLAGLRIDAPPPIELAHDGVSVTLPGSWNRGDCDDGVQCGFSPSTGERANDSWVYVFPWKAESVDAGATRLLDSLGRQDVRDLLHEPVEIGGRPAIRVRFAMSPKDTGPAEVEELVLAGDDGIVLIALAWRTPEGRAQLDSVMTTLRL